MSRGRAFNPHLRSFILIHAIRQEQLSSDILKFMFRILSSNTKTLGNKSSSLSFRSKIDLLIDFGKIDSEENKYFSKLLEIRNQFAHNPKCNSFQNLSLENKELTDFITKKFPNEEIDTERNFIRSYIELFKYCHRKLCLIKSSYHQDFLLELQKYNAYTLLEYKFDDWVKEAKTDMDEQFAKYPRLKMLDPISIFISSLNLMKSKKYMELSEEVAKNGKILNEIFARKI